MFQPIQIFRLDFSSDAKNNDTIPALQRVSGNFDMDNYLMVYDYAVLCTLSVKKFHSFVFSRT